MPHCDTENECIIIKICVRRNYVRFSYDCVFNQITSHKCVHVGNDAKPTRQI